MNEEITFIGGHTHALQTMCSFYLIWRMEIILLPGDSGHQGLTGDTWGRD